jgi:large subunit ribosomal protein L19
MAIDKIALVEKACMKEKVPDFNVGDTVDVHVKILEEKEGKEKEIKERIQIFNGTVISRSGKGINEMFCVRRIVAGEGVERVFPIHSPAIADIVVQRKGRVRRAKLYYLRDLVGKATKVREKIEPQANAKMSKAEKKQLRKAKAGGGAAAPKPEAAKK